MGKTTVTESDILCTFDAKSTKSVGDSDSPTPLKPASQGRKLYKRGFMCFVRVLFFHVLPLLCHRFQRHALSDLRKLKLLAR